MSNERPEIVTDDHLEYLNVLHDLGATIVFGAEEYLEKEFDMSSTDAQTVISYWISIFGNPNR